MASAFLSNSNLFLAPITPSRLFPGPSRTFQSLSIRRSFRVAVSDPKIIDGEEGNQPHQNNSQSKAEVLKMKPLIQAYKDAVLSGAEEVISDIEAAICRIEKEKDDLFEKLEEMETAKESGKEQFLRLNADFENFRKRAEKDRLGFISNIQEELMENLLPVVDSFEKIKQQIKPETEKETKIDTSYRGIYKQLVETLRASRVAVVETVGKKFDPSVHEAVARVESEQFREGIVVHEVRRGFLLGDKLLRPAMVKVSSGPGVKRVQPSTEDSAGEPVTEAEPDEGPAPIIENS